MARSIKPQTSSIKSSIKSSITFAAQPFSSTFTFLKTNFVDYYKQLMKINLITGVLGFILGLLIAAALGSFVSGETPIISANSPLFIPMILFVVLATITLVWGIQTLFLSQILLTEASVNKKKFSLFESFNSLKLKSIASFVVSVLIWLVLIIPLVLLFVLAFSDLANSAGNSSSGVGSVVTALAVGVILKSMLLVFIAIVYLIFVSLVFAFLSQFWMYEFILGGLGIIGSLKSSFRLVTKNLVKVILFDIFFVVVLIALSIPLIIVDFVLKFGLELVSIVLSSANLSILVYGVSLIETVLSAIISAVLIALTSPIKYMFWKSLRS